MDGEEFNEAGFEIENSELEGEIFNETSRVDNSNKGTPEDPVEQQGLGVDKEKDTFENRVQRLFAELKQGSDIELFDGEKAKISEITLTIPRHADIDPERWKNLEDQVNQDGNAEQVLKGNPDFKVALFYLTTGGGEKIRYDDGKMRTLIHYSEALGSHQRTLLRDLLDNPNADLTSATEAGLRDTLERLGFSGERIETLAKDPKAALLSINQAYLMEDANKVVYIKVGEYEGGNIYRVLGRTKFGRMNIQFVFEKGHGSGKEDKSEEEEEEEAEDEELHDAEEVLRIAKTTYEYLINLSPEKGSQEVEWMKIWGGYIKKFESILKGISEERKGSRKLIFGPEFNEIYRFIVEADTRGIKTKN
ncbi:MAG: hypothetical protein WD187_01070 [Candidatus Woykebacteria bacterium]